MKNVPEIDPLRVIEQLAIEYGGTVEEADYDNRVLRVRIGGYLFVVREKEGKVYQYDLSKDPPAPRVIIKLEVFLSNIHEFFFVAGLTRLT